MQIKSLAAWFLPVVLGGCSPGESTPQASSTPPPGAAAGQTVEPDKRWYARHDVSQGGKVYLDNCAVCHGKQGEGAVDWRKAGPDGKYPAPPLNGTGHAWHHPLKILFHVVKNGSPGGQGNMPAWGEKLSDDEIIAAIAWFQSQWPDQIYSAWLQREAASRSKGKG